MPDLPSRIQRLTGRRPVDIRPIGSGASGRVDRALFDDASTLVVKSARDDDTDLSIEATGLDLLRDRSALPVPRVIAVDPETLVLEDMPGSSGGLHRAEPHAAQLIAALHRVTHEQGLFGCDRDGLIGPLPQPNTPTASWVEFFRERRLLLMTREAVREAALTPSLANRLEAVAHRLPELIPDRPPAALVHGDLWSGNVLAEGDRITALLDPAPHYAHAEVELAFITLFSTFGPAFFERYRELAGMDQESWGQFQAHRRHVYNLYPLLVHARLFGGTYPQELDATLRRIGF